jgi:uncharacterized DUF497 family protein
VGVVWTPRAGGRRIISMRKCNAKEVASLKALPLFNALGD